MQAIRTRIKKATSTRRGRIIFFTILSLIVAAIAGGIIYWNLYKKKIIREQLESAISSKSKGLYSIKYENLKLDEIAGNLSLENLQMTFDSTKYIALRDQNLAPATLLSINIPGLSVSGVKTPRALIDNEIVGGRVEILNPVIEIIYTNSGKDSARRAPTKEVYEQILGNLNLIRIDTVSIKGATISTRDLGSTKKKIELINTDVMLVNVNVDSASGSDTTRLLFSKEINIASEKLKWQSADARYDFGIDSIRLNSLGNSLNLKRFFMQPKLSEDAFTRSLKLATDRFDFTVNSLRIQNIDFSKLFEEEIFADSILIGSANFKIYRDIALPHDRVNRVGTYPNQAIAKLSMPASIKVVKIYNAFVEYKEKNPKTRKSGKIQFYGTSATMTNITNIPEAVKANNIMVVDAQTRFMNKTPLRATWKFYLNNPKGRFDLDGYLGKIYAPDVNVITVPMGPAKIEDGTIESLQFHFTAHDYGMAGTVKMLYDDLKIAVLGQDEDTKKFKKKGLASIAANILIKNSNPSKRKDEPRVPQVQFERDIHRSMFHMIWKTLFKGIKESAGINK